MKKIFSPSHIGFLFLLTAMMLILVSCGGGAGGNNNDPGKPNITLVSIEISPAISSISLGANQQFMSTGKYSDNSTKDLTDSVNWDSSTGAATISNERGSEGLVTTMAEGTTTITATLEGISGTTELEVVLTVIDKIPGISGGPYVDNHDGTVTDETTELMWQQEDDDITKIWADAITFCDDLVLGYSDFSDWRLPTKKELITILDYETTSPAIHDIFLNTNSGDYWSSSTYAYTPGYAWYVQFSNGCVNGGNKENERFVRCVRN